MKAIVLVSSDDELHARVDRTLGADCVLVRCAPGRISLPDDLDTRSTMIVLDGRSLDRATLIADLARCRADLGPGARAVAIANIPEAGRLEVIRTFHHVALEVILPGVERVDDLISAHLNDLTRTGGAATALELLLRTMPKGTHEILSVVLGGGLRVSSVKELASHLGKERSTIRKALRAGSSWTPTGVIDLAKASYAVVLLRGNTLSLADVTEAVRFSREGRALDQLIGRMFEMSAGEVQRSNRPLGASSWLERELLIVRSR